MVRPRNKNRPPKTKTHMIKVLTSGGFDPLHVGHIRLFKDAKQLGDELFVAINGDDWLKRKKGKVFMLEEERKEIIKSIKYVDEAIIYNLKEDHVGDIILRLKPHIFAKGGDRTSSNLPPEEIEACKMVGCKIVYGVGGDKIQSSSWLLKNWEEE